MPTTSQSGTASSSAPGGVARRTDPHSPKLTRAVPGQRSATPVSGGPTEESASASAFAATWKARRAGPRGISGSSTTAASARA